MKPLLDSFKHWSPVLLWALAVCRTALKMLRMKRVKKLWLLPVRKACVSKGDWKCVHEHDFSLEQQKKCGLTSLWWWKVVKMALVGKRICDCQEAVREEYYGLSWLVSVYRLCECIYGSVKLEPRIGCGVSPTGRLRELALHSVWIHACRT